MLVPECMEEARSGLTDSRRITSSCGVNSSCIKDSATETTELASMGFVWIGMLDLWRDEK